MEGSGYLSRIRGLSIAANAGLLKGMPTPSLLYDSGAQLLKIIEKRRIEVLDMASLRSVLGVNVIYKIMSWDMKKRCVNRKDW